MRALVVALAASALAAAEDVPGGGPALVDAVESGPRWNLTYLDDRLELHPRAVAGGTWTSNIDGSREPEDAWYLTGGAGLGARFEPTRLDRFEGAAEAVTDVFPDDAARDVAGGRLALAWIHAQETWETALGGGASRRLERSEATGATLALDQATGLASWNGRGRALEAGLVARVRRDDWDVPGPGYSEADRDALAGSLALPLRWRWSERASGWLRIVADRNDYVRDGRYLDSSGIAGVVGATIATGTRSQLSAEAGAARRRFADDFAHDPAYDDAVVWEPLAECGWYWDWESGSRIHLRAFATRYDGERANSTRDSGGQAELRLRLRRESALILRGTWHHLVDSGAPAGERPWRAEEPQATFILRHRIGRGLEAAWRSDWYRRDASDAGDFTIWRHALSLGVLL